MSTRKVVGTAMKTRRGDSMVVSVQGIAGNRVIDVRKHTETGGLTPYGLMLTPALWSDLLPIIQQGIAMLDAE